MDEKLYKALEHQSTPFMKSVLICDDWLIINDLVDCLCTILELLKFKYGNEIIFINEDWHNHDGFVNDSKKINWIKFENITNSRTSLYNNRFDDDSVFSSFYPESLGFLLRVDIFDEEDDEQYPGVWGEFNLFANDEVINEIINQLNNELTDKLKIENSVQYMKNAYAG